MLLLPLTTAFAQAPAADIPAAPRFEIVRFAVDGNTLLTQQDIDRAVTPYTGKNKDFADIQRALEALEQKYRDRGYGIVQVLLPEQDITRGVVQLRVVEPRIGKVVVEGNKNFDTPNVLRSLPKLKPGTTPNSQDVARNLQLLAEHPAKQTTVLLRGGANDNEVDATVRVTDEKPLKYVVTADNTGTDATGRFRVGFGFQNSNALNRDHTLNLQYVTNPEHPSKVTIFGAGYRIPLYSLSSSIDLIAGYSDVDSGTLPGLISVSGSGTIFAARYNYYLPKLGEYEHKVSFGYDYRAFKNEVTLQGVGLVPDITIHPASVTYNGLWRMTSAELGFYVSYSRNIPNFPSSSDASDADFNATRFGATAIYRVVRAGMNYSRVFAKEWQLRAVLNGQYTNDALVPGEQFGYGGPDSVRGFNSREIANDRGYSANLEVYTPELGSKFEWRWKDVKARALAFYDLGYTDRVNPLPGDPVGEYGSSVGVGLRVAAGKNLSLRADFANVVNAAGLQNKRDIMIHAGMALVF